MNSVGVVHKLTIREFQSLKRYEEIHGWKWCYIEAAPVKQPFPTAATPQTIILLHGFPDLAFGWRNQIPMFTHLGFRCIALECMGYGDTGSRSSSTTKKTTKTTTKDITTSPLSKSPSVETEEEEDYTGFTFKFHADAIVELARRKGIERLIVGGHDWGAVLAFRLAQWRPSLVTAVFSVCTPFIGVQDRYTSLQSLPAEKRRQFGYQIQFGSAGKEIEKAIGLHQPNEGRVRKFLAGVYGGRVKSGKRFMTLRHGVDLPLLLDDREEIDPPRRLFTDQEFDFYVKEFLRTGLSGPLNWYRVRKANWEDDQKMAEENKKTIRQPTLYILATKDPILTRDLAVGMEKSVPNLTWAEVPAGHWALWETAEQTNRLLKEWIQAVVLGEKSKL